METSANIVLTNEDPAAVIRTWLAEILRGDSPDWIFGEDFDSEQILTAALQEGIITLLHQRLLEPQHAQSLPPAFRDKLAAAAQTKVAKAMIRKHHCRVILAQLDRAGIPALLLKGSALAYWAYASPYLRECSDIDLLLSSRTDVDRVVEILHELKFDLRVKTLPGDLVCFEMACVGTDSTNAGLDIDLHWQLSSTPVFAFRFTWNELYSNAIKLPKLASNAYGIAAVPAFMHACMHRVQNMASGPSEKLKWLYDLYVLGEIFSPRQWEELTQQAIQRGLAGTCADGIRAATESFGEFAPDSTQATLKAAATLERMDVKRMHRWWYFQRMSLLAFPSIRKRFRWLRQRLIPDRAYTRDRYGIGKGFWRSLTLRFRAGANRLRN